jgi:hypothetical protein
MNEPVENVTRPIGFAWGGGISELSGHVLEP